MIPERLEYVKVKGILSPGPGEGLEGLGTERNHCESGREGGTSRDPQPSGVSVVRLGRDGRGLSAWKERDYECWCFPWVRADVGPSVLFPGNRNYSGGAASTSRVFRGVKVYTRN